MANHDGHETSGPLERLQGIMRGMDSALVAFSGGIDSTLVLKTAHDVLGDRTAAVTAVSATFPAVELALARQLCAEIGVHQILHDTDQLRYDGFIRNDAARCYHCKTDLYSALIPLAERMGFAYLLDGTHRDDAGDERPGLRAAREHGVRSPLLEAAMGKADIRETAKILGLSNWDKPAAACLSSRIARGDIITVEKLARVERAEAFLLGQGFRQVRVRDYAGRARVEVGQDELGRLFEPAMQDRVTLNLAGLGFTEITLDSSGYRQGSTNIHSS